jgi:hypothetical protein
MKYYYRYLFGFIFFLFIIIPIIFWDNSCFQISDNLESFVPSYMVIVKSGLPFSLDPNSIVPQIMNGVPRFCLISGFNIITLLLLVFRPFTAYLANYLLVHIIAFIGMFLFLKRHILPKDDDDLIVLGTSLCFSLLPFYTLYGLTIAGQPLFFFALLNIRDKKDRYYDWLIILLFPFYSSFMFIGIFLVIIMFTLFLYGLIKNKTHNIRLLSSTILLSTLYCLSEFYTMYATFFNRSFISHRTEWFIPKESFLTSFNVSIDNFLNGQYHAESLHQYVLIAAAFALVLLFIRKKGDKLLTSLLLLTLAISFWFGFFRWEGLYYLKEHFYLIRTFGWDRIHWIHPFLWYVIFALSLSIIKNIRYGALLIFTLILLQANWNFIHSDVHQQLEGSINIMNNRPSKLLTYKRFYSEKLFSEIKEYIGRPQNEYRVVSIGLAPAVSQYNGFYTLDGYISNYPLEYKHKFRKIIAKELDKYIYWKDSYDKWGSRCVIYVSELPSMLQMNSTKNYDRKIKHLELNTKALKDLGGEYIFSAVEIKNYKENNLQFLRVFEEKDSLWRIFLYKVK